MQVLQLDTFYIFLDPFIVVYIVAVFFLCRISSCVLACFASFGKDRLLVEGSLHLLEEHAMSSQSRVVGTALDGHELLYHLKSK